MPKHISVFAVLSRLNVVILGEAWRTYFEPDRLHGKLTELGFIEIEDLGPPQFAARYFPHRASSVSEKAGIFWTRRPFLRGRPFENNNENH